jgi:MHS family proline/betaine transporter-like MFS transporter
MNASGAPVLPPVRQGRVIAAAAIGNAFEWYDFTIYVLFAPYIARAFFPGGSPTAELVKAFLVFGVGFIARPLGAVLIGHYADTAGRKAALTLTFAIMAVGVATIAFAPTYAAIGAGAPVLILAGRLLQGLSAGGEIGGAATFLVEHAPEGTKARAAAWLQASMALSNIMGAFIGLAVHALLNEAQIMEWGWRLPFLFGLLIVPLGFWLRRTLPETQEFVQAEGSREKEHAPLRAVLREWPGLLRGFAISVLWGVSIYALVIFMPVHLQQALGFSSDAAFTASLAGNLVLAGTCFVSGGLADRLGHRRQMMFSILALLVAVPALMALLIALPIFPVLLIVHVCFCGLVGLFSGAAPAVLAQLFPAPVRARGLSISYNGALTIFAGFAPAIITWLAASMIGPSAPAIYVALAALVALFAVPGLTGRRDHPASILPV